LDSNVTDDSTSHSAKHLTQRISTDAGIQIYVKEHNANAPRPIVFNFDSDSNVDDAKTNEERNRQNAKQYSEIVSMPGFNLTIVADPKYRIAEWRSVLIRKSPQTWNRRLSSSTATRKTPLQAIAAAGNTSSEAGFDAMNFRFRFEC
jgi:hypothetical protein